MLSLIMMIFITGCGNNIQPPVSLECENNWNEKNSYCDQFSYDTCNQQLFEIDYKQKTNCQWDTDTSSCEAPPFCA